MGIISRLIGSSELLLYHDYRSGSFRDFSGNSKHGIPTVTKLDRTGANFSSLTGSWINTGSAVVTASAGSAFCYCRPFSTGEGNYGRLFSDNTFEIYINNNTRLAVRFGTIQTSAVGTFLLNQDHFVALAWDASGIANLYIDGVLVIDTLSINSPAGGSDFHIGNRPAHDRQFIGKIYAGGMLNTELTASEIQELEAEVRSKKWNQKTIFRSSIGSKGLPLDDNVIASYSLPNVTDLTGNGYNATLAGSPRKIKTSVGQAIDILDNSGNYVDLPLTIWPGTTGALEFITKCHSSGAGNARLFGFNATGNEEMRTYSNADGKMIFYYWGDGGARNTGGTTEFTYGRVHHVVFQWEYDGSTNTTYKVFVDGVETDSDTWADPHPTPDIDGSLGKWGSSSYDGEIYEFAVHNTARTATQWTARMNQFFQKEAIGLGNGARETTSDLAAGDPVPGTPFTVYSGTWKTTYTTINGKPVKAFECTSAGAIMYAPVSAFQNTSEEGSFGTWEFWVKKASAGNALEVMFSGSATDISSSDGYYWLDNTTELDVLRRRQGGVGNTNLMVSGSSFNTPGTWYHRKITRNGAGVITVYRDGVLVPATGGGSNPTSADLTYTEANYFVLSVDNGNQVAIAAFDGTPLFVKRKGVA